MSSYMSLPGTRCLQTQPQASWMCTCRKMVACRHALTVPVPRPVHVPASSNDPNVQLFPTYPLHSSSPPSPQLLSPPHPTPLHCSPPLIFPPSLAHGPQHHLTISLHPPYHVCLTSTHACTSARESFGAPTFESSRGNGHVEQNRALCHPGSSFSFAEQPPSQTRSRGEHLHNVSSERT